jgi:hypothetical protein
VPSSAPTSHVSAGRVLTLSVIFFLVAAGLCLCLGFGWIPGYPESAEKSVSIYYQVSGKPADLGVYLHPPLNFVQTDGLGQLVAFQFTNRSSTSITVHSLELSSPGCFRLEPYGRKLDPSPLLILSANQSELYWYRLLPVDDLGSCSGQTPLVFIYTWQQAATSSPAQLQIERQSISTGPVRVTTRRSHQWERFFNLLAKIGPLILLPVLLAIGNYLLQELQQRRADSQKEKDDHRTDEAKLQEQKLEVWKAMVPDLVRAIRDHYVPIVRLLSILVSEADRKQGADHNQMLACALLFRSKINAIIDKNGGFYFKNLLGEEICAVLANLLNERFSVISGDSLTFQTSVESLPSTNSLAQVRQLLAIDAPPAGPFADVCARFRQHFSQELLLAQLRCHWALLEKILGREINDPFLRFWYEEEPSALDLPALLELLTNSGMDQKNEADLEPLLTKYAGRGRGGEEPNRGSR